MAFRLVGSAGTVAEPAVISVAGSGVVKRDEGVDIARGGTGGAVVSPTTSSSTTTMIFGVSMDYAQGASNTIVRVIPFTDSQLWEVDCANEASTAQCGIRHTLSASDRGVIHNTASDVTDFSAIFHALAAVGTLASGSGKLIGRFQPDYKPVPVNSTTFKS